jgi:hypothetical protein
MVYQDCSFAQHDNIMLSFVEINVLRYAFFDKCAVA